MILQSIPLVGRRCKTWSCGNPCQRQRYPSLHLSTQMTLHWVLCEPQVLLKPGRSVWARLRDNVEFGIITNRTFGAKQYDRVRYDRNMCSKLYTSVREKFDVLIRQFFSPFHNREHDASVGPGMCRKGEEYRLYNARTRTETNTTRRKFALAKARACAESDSCD